MVARGDAKKMIVKKLQTMPSCEDAVIDKDGEVSGVQSYDAHSYEKSLDGCRTAGRGEGYE